VCLLWGFKCGIRGSGVCVCVCYGVSSAFQEVCVCVYV